MPQKEIAKKCLFKEFVFSSAIIYTIFFFLFFGLLKTEEGGAGEASHPIYSLSLMCL